jgi:hypothetical protein
MLASINFDANLQAPACKIQDVRADGQLSGKTRAHVTQSQPYRALVRGCATAQALALSVMRGGTRDMA